jgi:hypothetical protein
MDKKSDNNRFNPHFNPGMRDYVLDLWMKGCSQHVIDRLIRKKLDTRRPRRQQGDNIEKNCA